MKPKRTVLLVVAFVIAAAIIERSRTRLSTVTGSVVTFEVGKMISVANEAMPYPREFYLNDTTTFHGNRDGALRRGAKVTGSYRRAGERHPLAQRIQVVDRNN